MQFDSRSPLHYGWDYPSVPTTPSAPPIIPFDHSAVFDDPFSFHSPVSSPTPLHYDVPISPYSVTQDSVGSVQSGGRSPSPFSVALSTSSSSSSEPAELFDAAADVGVDSPRDESFNATDRSSPLPDSPTNSSEQSIGTLTPTVPIASFRLPLNTGGTHKRTRERIRGLTREQRAERKRTKHRQIDASRRQKEITAMNSLRTIVVRQAGRAGSKNGEGSGDDDEAEQDSEAAEAVSKAVVLESSVELIQQLQALCAKMQQSCNAKDEKIVRLATDLRSVIKLCNSELDSSPVDAVLSSATSHVGGLARSASLRQSTLVSSSVCMMVLFVPLSIVIDVNDAFVQCGGWSREELLQTVIRPAKPGQPESNPEFGDYPVCPLLRNRQSFKQRRRELTDGQSDDSAATATADNRTAVQPYVPQYGASIQAMVSLIYGVKHKIDCVWRCRASDGSLYEINMSAWRESYSGNVNGSDGGQPMRAVGDGTSVPVVAAGRIMTAHSLYDRVLVDETDVPSVDGLVLG